MNTKLVSGIMAGVVLILGLTGCAGTTTEASSPKAQASSEAPLPSWASTMPDPSAMPQRPESKPSNSSVDSEDARAVIDECETSVTDDLQMSPDIVTFTHEDVTRSVIGGKHFYDDDDYVNDIEFMCVGIKAVDGVWEPGGHESVTIGGVTY